MIIRKRQNRANLIEVFKRHTFFPAIPLLDLIQIDTRHSWKLVKCRCKKDISEFFFSHRVVSKWNMLEDNTVMAKRIV